MRTQFFLSNELQARYNAQKQEKCAIFASNKEHYQRQETKSIILPLHEGIKRLINEISKNSKSILNMKIQQSDKSSQSTQKTSQLKRKNPAEFGPFMHRSVDFARLYVN